MKELKVRQPGVRYPANMTKAWSCCAATARVIDAALILGDMLNKNVSPRHAVDNLVFNSHE